MVDKAEKDATRDAYNDFSKCESVNEKINVLYRKSSQLLQSKIEGVFGKYGNLGLSDRHARRILSMIRGGVSKSQILSALKASPQTNGVKELIKIISDGGLDKQFSDLKSLETDINSTVKRIEDEIVPVCTDLYLDIFIVSYYMSIYRMQTRSGYGFPFYRATKSQAEKALSDKLFGRNFKQSVAFNSKNLRDDLIEALYVDLLTGSSEKDVKDSINVEFAKGERANHRLVRTETAIVRSEAIMQSYGEAGIQAYQYSAILDARTSEMCRRMDGNIYRYVEAEIGVNFPPMHPWCRSTTVPVMGDSVLSKLRKTAYDPKTGERIVVDKDMTYGEWYSLFVEDKK